MTILQIEIHSSAESSPIVERGEIAAGNNLCVQIIEQVFLEYSLCMNLIYLFGLNTVTADLKFELGRHKNPVTALRLLSRCCFVDGKFITVMAWSPLLQSYITASELGTIMIWQ